MKYESPITCHSKDMANVKVFADKQTGQKLYAPDLSIRGHKKNYNKPFYYCINDTLWFFFHCYLQ
jgi:hypothetical protein